MIINIVKNLSLRGLISLSIANVAYLLQSITYLLVTITIFHVIFSVVNESPIYDVYLSIMVIICTIIVRSILGFIADIKKHETAFDLSKEIRNSLITKLKLFNLNFYTKERLGKISTILQKDIDNMANIVGHVWVKMLSDIIYILIVFIVLYSYSRLLDLILISSLIIPIVFLMKSIKKSMIIELETSDSQIRMVNALIEYIRGIYVIKTFSNNTYLDEQLDKKIEKFGENSKRNTKSKGGQLALYSFLLDCSYVFTVFVGYYFVSHEYMTINNFVIFIVISREIYKRLGNASFLYMNYISASDSYKRIEKITNTEIIKDDKKYNYSGLNEIKFNNVSFCYQKNGFCLDNINFTVKRNSITALVGESGSGKTTIINLLLRLYDVNKGNIYIGKTNIKEMSYSDLLDTISIVSQDVQIFNSTIYENIAIGKKNATKDEVILAAKKARIHEYIIGLKQGYNTFVGENGSFLSGGQKQRISIARAFLKDSPIMLLDEITSNMDSLNEAMIQESISELSKDRAVLIIAHRLRTIKDADQILVMNNGNILEKGTFTQLKENKGYFYKLYMSI